MGAQVLHQETAESSHGMSSYRIIAYGGQYLPKAYKGLLYSNWLRSLRNGNDYYKLAEPARFYAAYKRHIGHILSLPDTVVRIAVLADDHDVALGFSVSRGDVLDYVHVLKDQRRHGVGTSLVPNDIKYTTHLTRTGFTILRNKYAHWKFDPFG